jgi:flagellar M-ring protein FliF
MEQRLGQSVEEMLGRTLGPGHVRAEATVEMDFDRVNETQEKFDPDGQVVRNQQNVTDASKNTEATATTTVQNNLPNPDGAAAGGSGSASNRTEENTTFEIGKTVRTTVRDTPTIKKISMAVLVDGITTKADDGKQAWAELSQPDLDRIATLVKSAVGFDEKRGDRVEVVNMRFSLPDELGDGTPSGYAWLQFGKADMIWLITMGATALVALFALGFVVRPLGMKLVAGMAPPPVIAADPPGQSLALEAPANPTALLAGDNAEGDDTMLNVPNIQGEVRASSIRKLGELVDKQLDASVTVIRGWLSQGVS